MTEGEWIALAERRVSRILQRRRYASIRQLEKKISEAGPPEMRPEPVKVSRAVARLVRAGHVISEAAAGLPTFYMPSNFGLEADAERRTEIVDLTKKFHALTQNRTLCGDAFESVVKAAALQSGQYRVISPAKQGMEIDGYILEKECDHILHPKTFVGPSFVIEDKNLREWLTPSSEEVWALIGKTLRIPGAVPVLVCRRMHYVGYGVFKGIGLLCWQVYRQYFDPAVENQLGPMRHKDGLGFSDLTTNLEPPVALIRFFEKTLPAHGDLFKTRFEAVRPVLEKYAIEYGMENDDLVVRERSELYEQFRRELFPPEEPEAGYGFEDF
jgi:hypothetical protein